MIYIGIDFSMNSNGEILIENFSFYNDSCGFELFLILFLNFQMILKT